MDIITGGVESGMGEAINCFPGYEYKLLDSDHKYHNIYRGTDLGRGGYVFGAPGIYTNVALLDIQSMHPNSAVNLNYFGEYTPRFKEILDTRIAIKNGDYDRARSMFDGKIAKYLNDESTADQLASALKIVINSCYGLSSASFENAFRDERNVNNIIALRGALFMRTLQDEITDRGYLVAGIRTDSIKIPNADKSIIDFCTSFAEKYGYKFEHEATYDRMCLIDKAQYIAAYMRPEECEKLYGYVPKDNAKQFKKYSHPWTATGDEFQRPYIFKTLFSGEPIEFDDCCETNTVKDAAIYLDMNEGYPDVSREEEELSRRRYNELHPNDPKKLYAEYANTTDAELEDQISTGHNYVFIGRVGRFYPIRPGCGGGLQKALRKGSYNYVSGSKGFRWLEAEVVKSLGKEEDIDPRYHEQQANEAIAAINKFGSFERFVDLSKPYIPPEEVEDRSKLPDDDCPFSLVPCGDGKYNTCMECPNCVNDVCKRGYSLASYIEGGGT